MSGEMVFAPEAAAGLAAAAFGAIAVAAAGVALIAVAAPISLGGVVFCAAKAGSSALGALEEAAKRKRKERIRETEALGREIGRLARSAAKKAPVLSEEFLEENRRTIEQTLNNLDLEKAVLDIEALKSSKPTEEQSAAACRELYAALALINPSAARSCEDFMRDIDGAPRVRQKAIRDNLRFEYGRTIREKSAALWRGRKAAEALASLSGDDAKDFKRALDAVGYPDADLTEKAFEELQRAYASLLEKDLLRKQRALLESGLIADMKKIGYSPVGAVEPGKPIYFYTGEKDYRVMARVNPDNGQLSLRFVRVVASEKEKAAVTTAQKRRDLEQERKWCANASRLLAALSSETGFNFKELYRKEPEEGEAVLTILDASLAAAESRRERHAEN
ncbi:MAG: hypothetical protein K2H64_03875 [Desulfovibrio sp.]|nr:hypothetical protein [Desulfovibrio sp.]